MSAVSAGSSIAGGISQNQAAANATAASGKLAQKEQEISTYTAYFHNQMREELSQLYFKNQTYATETEAQLLEFTAGGYDAAAESAARRASTIDSRINFMLKSGDVQAAVYNASANLLRARAGSDDDMGRITLDMKDEEIAAFRKKLAALEGTAKVHAAYSGVTGVVDKLMFENEMEGEQTARMMKLQGYVSAMGYWGQASDKRIAAMNQEGMGVQAQINATLSAIQGIEQQLSAEGESTTARVSAIFTRARANSARLGLVYQPPLVESPESVAGGKQYSPSGWSDITKGVQQGFGATEKAMDYFSKTGGTQDYGFTGPASAAESAFMSAGAPSSIQADFGGMSTFSPSSIPASSWASVPSM